jgi:spore coat protein U-like protein
MRRFISRSRLLLLLATMAVIFSWTPHQPADALAPNAAVLVIGARVDVRCMILAAPLSFGVYDITDPTALDADGFIVVDCTSSGRNNSNRVRIDQGQNPAAGSTAARPRRQMASSTNAGRLRYDLYQDAARTEVWGDTAATALFPGNATGPVNIPVHGRIPALQSGLTALPGSYSDTAVVTLYF